MQSLYCIIEIFTGEEARWKGQPVISAVVDHVRNARIAARCLVFRGIAGCYENGETANPHIEVLTFNMPLKIEILLPSAELAALLPAIEEMVTDGIVTVREADVRSHSIPQRLIPRHLKVRDVMTAAPVAVTESTPSKEIIRTLLGSSFHALPVVDPERRPCGVITQGDLITRAGMPVRLGLLALLERKRTEDHLLSLPEKTAGEIMTRPVVTIEQERDLGEAVDLMLARGLKRLPAVDGEGRLTGILTRLDVFKTITRESLERETRRPGILKMSDIRCVRDIMTRDIRSVRPETPVDEIIRFIDSGQTQRAAVVDGEDHLLGMISDRDLLGVFAEHTAGVWDYLMARMPFPEMARKHQELIRQTKMKTAAEVMKTDLTTILEDSPVEEAVRIMTERGIKRLPVVDEKGAFRGMISRDSLLSAGIKKS